MTGLIHSKFRSVKMSGSWEGAGMIVNKAPFSFSSSSGIVHFDSFVSLL